MKHKRVLWGKRIKNWSSGKPFMYFYYCLCCGSEILSINDDFNGKKLFCPECNALLDPSIPGTYLRIVPISYFNKVTKKIIEICYDDYHRMSLGEKQQFEEAYCTPDDEKKISEIFEYMKQLRINENAGNIRERVESLVTSYEALPYDGIKTDAESIKCNPNILKHYIEQLLNLESSIYSTEKRLEDLYRVQAMLEEDVKIVNNTFTKGYREAVERAKDAMKKLPTKETYAPLRPKEPVAPEEPVLKQPGLFNRKKIQAENEQTLYLYENKKKEYQHALEEYKGAIKAFEEKTIVSIARAERLAQADLEKATTQLQIAKDYPPNSIEAEEKKMIEAEIEEAKETLSKLIKGKKELYSQNVIFGKYRNIVALASFYEYLVSGRCDSLEGRDGAYNIYENEIRANQIISQLSDVLKSLEQIKRGQYMVYSMLNEISSSLSSLESTTNDALSAMDKMQGDISRIAHNSKVIAYNSERTAFYAKKNQKLTNALGYMIALK